MNLVSADYTSIENRVLAWLAGEEWKLEAFRAFDRKEGPDLYKVAAAGIYGVPIDQIDDDKRTIGKVAELALGFGGGVKAFQKMASNYRVEVPDAQAEEIKVSWRKKHPATTRFWYALEKSAIDAVENPGTVVTCGRFSFRVGGSFLWLRLPSGRSLCYPYPSVVEREVPWGGTRPGVSYKGVDSFTRKWTDCSAYSGLLAENVTQAVARDVMAEAMLRLDEEGYRIVGTIHDEVVAETTDTTIDRFLAIMTELPSWAEGLPLAAGGWIGGRYRK